MPRETYVWDKERMEMVPAADYYARKPRRMRSDVVKGPMLIRDDCEFKSMADGQVYTSKSKYRADLRARGLVEVGNDPAIRRPPPDPADHVLADMPPVEEDLKRVFERERSK